MKLNQSQLERYQRQIALDDFGEEKQIALLNSKVLIIGCGGLGSLASLSLAALGIGQIGLVDFDQVSLSNLQRQIIYDEEDLLKDKIDASKAKLIKKNSDVKIKTYKLKIDENNIKDIIKDYDIVMDCVDNFKTKLIINDACLASKIPLVSGGIDNYSGQVILIDKDSIFNLRSILPKEVNIDEKHLKKMLRTYPLAVHLVSSLMANEVVKYLLDIGEHLKDEMLVVDALKLEFKKYRIS